MEKITEKIYWTNLWEWKYQKVFDIAKERGYVCWRFMLRDIENMPPEAVNLILELAGIDYEDAIDWSVRKGD